MLIHVKAYCEGSYRDFCGIGSGINNSVAIPAIMNIYMKLRNMTNFYVAYQGEMNRLFGKRGREKLLTIWKKILKDRSLILICILISKVILPGFCLTQSRASFLCCCSYCRILSVWLFVLVSHKPSIYLLICYMATKEMHLVFYQIIPLFLASFIVSHRVFPEPMPPLATLTLRGLALHPEQCLQQFMRYSFRL